MGLKESEKHHDIILIFGIQGYGKTQFCKQFLENYSRVVVWDNKGEYQNVIRFTNIVDLDNYLLGKDRFRVGYYPQVGVCNVHGFEAFCEYIHSRIKENNWYDTLFIVEEIWKVCPGKDIPDFFDSIVRMGRNERLHVVCISQRAFDMPTTLRSQSSWVITFRQEEPRDLDYLRVKSRLLLEANTLDIGEYLEYKPGSIERKKLIFR